MGKEGLEHVLIRNRFYYENYQKLTLIAFLLVFMVIGLAGFALYQHMAAPRPLYFPTTPDGRPIPIIPLNQPLYKGEFVLEWAKKAVIAIYSLDFISFRQSLQEAQVYFTWEGHQNFMEAYRLSNNLEAVKARRQVVSAEIQGAGQVLQEGYTEEGIYFWALAIPVTFIYQNSESEMVRQAGVAQLVVQRDSLLRHPEGIAISQLVFQGK